ncbi:PD-(D/E)XK nuclease family protein [Halorhodospira halochloris]|uniref:PDDEXK-like family protein n=1 Tax=Halorhodospira halochloris TaxID=1052 RepID=UPI001EE7D271|nr:PD-(D/E)XK nuclease family protein [Halorhodospira halochloris]MCG5549274.1 PD-(D/E)XK nuclease family protein [Halorhodospira halochloris]
MSTELLMNDDLVEVVRQAREKANQHGDRFNIFSILRMQRNEVETHSRFLYELLKSNGRHGEGSSFLELFLEDVVGLQGAGEGRYRVSRELLTEDSRRLDILIESPTAVVGIELKIDAADQEKQLHDYHRELLRRAGGAKSVALVYLTLDGVKPTANSLHTLAKEEVYCRSFAEDIPRWLGGCIERSQHKPALAYAIRQYQRLIYDLTGKGGSMSDWVSRELKQDANRFKAALEIEKAMPMAKASVQEMFWEELRVALEKRFGVAPSVYGGRDIATIAADYYLKNKKHIGIRMPLFQRNDKTICLYANLYEAVHYGLRVESGSGKVLSCAALKAIFRDEIGHGNAIADKDADWVVCYYYDPTDGDDENMLNFYAFNDAAAGLLDQEKRRTLIGDMVSHQAKLAAKCEEICKGIGAVSLQNCEG